MKPAACILLLYTGFVAGSIQVMALPDKWEGLGVVIMVTIILLIVGIARAKSKRKTVKAMPKRSSVVRKRSAVKSKLKVAKS